MVYEWIERFGESGFRTFEQAPNPKGRPPIITGLQIRELIDIALSNPAERGRPFSAWTVPKLAEYCRHRGLLPPSPTSGCAGGCAGRDCARSGSEPGRRRMTPRSTGKNASGSSTGSARRARR